MLIANTRNILVQNHGYDNDEPDMHAIFIAHVPSTSETNGVYASHSRVMRAATSCSNSVMNSISTDVHVLDGFQNVEVYNLVVTLLGIGDKAAPNNGTDGFWDRYVGI